MPYYPPSSAASGPVCLKDFYTDVGNVNAGETDLYSFTTVANQLSAVGQKLTATFGGLGASAGTRIPTLRAYFAGTSIFDAVALSSTNVGGFSLSVTIIRTGASTARAVATYSDDSQISDVDETDLTGLTFSGTNILKITGQDTGTLPASNTIVAKLGTISWVPAGP